MENDMFLALPVNFKQKYKHAFHLIINFCFGFAALFMELSF